MMKIRVLFPLLLLLCAFAPALAQSQIISSSTEQPQTIAPAASLAPQAFSVAPQSISIAQPVPAALSVQAISASIDEAKRLLKSRAATGTNSPSNYVTLAALDTGNKSVQLLSLEKELFLKRGSLIETRTAGGELLRVTVERANGVNTAVQIYNQSSGRALVPLVVQYPILRDGELREMAYYTSAHTALLSGEVVAEGNLYVRRMLDAAAARLRDEGVAIEPSIVDIAEHLCIVEHTDHKRFMSEDRGALFREILSLYALNEPDTYRYSVSVAGAGGMVQMIPSTYKMVRSQHPNIALKEDFVSGMTDHSNALAAMLLYMQDTWNDLLRNPEVVDALNSGIATQPELVAAGYNSNPARLPSYLKRGGAGWRDLIPAETQMYLRIYASLHQLQFNDRPAPRPDPQPAGITPLLATLLSVWKMGATGSAPFIHGLLPSLAAHF